MSKTLAAVKRQHVAIWGCPNEQTFCKRAMRNLNPAERLDNCPICGKYAIGQIAPNYPVPALSIGARITPHIVDIVTHKQPTFHPALDYVECDHEGIVWSLAHWWQDKPE